ncbi:unnamed protein product [Rotaria socialis]|uniref:Uncharacterized protein n=1 Tax=Rotaria socialis TaxID=392032 RepID=A0A817XAX9_9BILA|nr:unnamed protein product [Rotaria socialis]
MIDSGAYGQVILAYDYLFQICIRWYRASELVLCDGTYTSAMDMWREDKKEKLYKEYQKKIEMINKHNPDDYDKYSTASVDMDLTPLTIDTTTPKEPEKLGVASCITPDLDKLFNLYTKILDPEESDRDGLS